MTRFANALGSILLGSIALAAAPEPSQQAREGDSAPEFAVDVMSVLSKAGCNAGTCHGNLNGKGGLKLSLRGDDAAFDHRALVSASRGRRVNLSVPEWSLILRKATGEIPHRGGIRFDRDSENYRVLADWLRHGGAAPSADAVSVTRLEVTPSEAIVVAPQTELDVKVLAHFSDGTSLDVTDRACYEMSNLSAEVDSGGQVRRLAFGETTLIVRYLQQQLPVPIAFTESRPDFRWRDPKPSNAIDRFVLTKLKRLKVNPSALCDDIVFLRRAYLDAIGRLPTAEEAKSFHFNDQPDKRAKVIDHLLTRPEFADYWALKWADVLRTEEKVLDDRGVEVFHAWIRDGIANGRSLDQFARELITGKGSTYDNPPANFYRANRDASTRGETTARLFLGTRLQCAKCHNHPFDRWTQADYYRWSSLFSQLDYDLGENKRRDKLDKNEFVGEQTVLVRKQSELRNPANGQLATPKFLGGRELSEAESDQRLESVASWLTSPENELFAKSQANFVWYHLIGRGLVDPIDDFRMTNPANHPPLMDYLADELVRGKFALRPLVRQIMNSRTYQLSALPNDSNRHDTSGFSRALVRRLPAEVILDMQSDVLDDPAQFVGYPTGIRAVQIPGVHRKSARGKSPLLGDRFLKTFGKPERILSCDCERSNETTLKQAFVLIGDGLSSRLDSPDNQLQRWAASTMSSSELIDNLYWTALSRSPRDEEKAAAEAMIDASVGRANALEDIAWALMNAKEFLFRR